MAPLATSVQKADINARPAVVAANQDYDKLTNPNNSIPSPPMHAAGLAALVKKLATAEGAVAESIKARQALILGLENLLETNRAKLNSEQAQLTDLTTRKQAIESRKQEVEDAILRGLSAADTHAISSAPLPGVIGGKRPSAQDVKPPERPDIEELTPPPMESFTPVGSPRPDFPAVPDDVLAQPAAHPVEPIAVPAPSDASAFSAPVTAVGEGPGADLLNRLTRAQEVDSNANGHHAYSSSAKKRKTSRSAAEDEFAAFAGDGDIDGIDANLGNLI